MDVNERVRELMKARGWTEYRLAKESGLSNSTIANLFRRNNAMSIPTLEAICEAFGLTISQFFADNELVELNDEQQKMFNEWLFLSAKEKRIISDLISLLYDAGKRS